MQKEKGQFGNSIGEKVWGSLPQKEMAFILFINNKVGRLILLKISRTQKLSPCTKPLRPFFAAFSGSALLAGAGISPYLKWPHAPPVLHNACYGPLHRTNRAPPWSSPVLVPSRSGNTSDLPLPKRRPVGRLLHLSICSRHLLNGPGDQWSPGLSFDLIEKN